MLIKAGTTLVFETGEYSDYSFTGPFMVVKDFDQAIVVEEFKEQFEVPEEDRDWIDGPDTGDFIGWLSREGYVEDIANVVSWHIGSYGRLEAEPQ